MRKVTVLDTSVASTNVGDQIIMEAVDDHLSEVFPDALCYRVASHEYMGWKSRGLVRQSDFAIAGGTNLLSSRMWFRSVWKLNVFDLFFPANVILMGCGWYQHQRKPDFYSQQLLRRVLSREHCHSVRDDYTRRMLSSIGVDNVINTGCPTLWRMTPELCQAIPQDKADYVVTTLNTYIPDPASDAKLLRLLRSRYKEVFLWIQTATDYAYAKGLGVGVTFVDPNLRAYDDLLQSSIDLDYVGTRLHGGIRALQFGRRTVILEVDNRAREMGKDFALPTVDRSDVEKVEQLVMGPLQVRLKQPVERIARWKGQFEPRATEDVPVAAAS